MAEITEQQLLEKTQERMDKIGLPNEDEESTTVETTPAEPTTEETTPAEPTTEETTPDDSVTGYVVPDNYRRAAIHQDWTAEEIDDLAKNSPVQAEKTFKKLYDTTNSLSQRFAEVGRTIMQQSKEVPPTPVTEPTRQTLSDDDIEKITDEYGDDDPIVNVIKQLNSNISRLTAPRPVPTVRSAPVASPKQVNSEVDELIGMQIEQFFENKSLVSDEGFYGTGEDWKDLTPGQTANRMAVTQLADQLKVGAVYHGQKVTNVEALTMANDMFTAQFVKKTVTKEIKDSLKKRENNLTVEPSGSSVMPEKTGNIPEEELLKRTSQRLRKIFGN